jgi:hypothetical protein
MDEKEKHLQELMAAHATRNQTLAATISNYGIPLDKKRVADVNFWSPDEPTAKALADALTRDEFASVRTSEGATKRSVTCQLGATVTGLISPEFTELLVRLADKYGSEYDGWGTALVELAQESTEKSSK